MKKISPGLLLAILGSSAALLGTGCARTPDAKTLRLEVQKKLDRDVKPGLFEIVTFRRMGTSSLPVADSGTRRRIAYFNVALRFKEDYDFGGWEKLSPASLAFVLGATEKGLFGVKARNQAGDIVHAYGTATFVWIGDAWVPTAALPRTATAVPYIGNTAPPIRSKQLIDKLAAMVNLPPPGVTPQEDDVISEELDRAAQNIQHRIERRHHVYTLASGPAGSEYSRFTNALVLGVRKYAKQINVRNLETNGSIQNARFLSRQEADYAILQSDVANYAMAGRGPFAETGPITTLRCVASLFPETVHIVVKASSPVRSVADLRGLSADLGLPDSGSQYDAEAILSAYGLHKSDLAHVTMQGPEKAAQQLRQGKIDALFVTASAPVPALQELASQEDVRLLPIAPAIVKRLKAQYPGMIGLTLPPGTYPGQTADIPTVGVAALLVTTEDAPDAEVERVLNFMFTQISLPTSGSSEGAKVSPRTALQGITIPMHPGASRYFERRPTS